MRLEIAVICLLLLSVLLFWTEFYIPSTATLTPTPTPWGTPPWWPNGVALRYVCPYGTSCDSPAVVPDPEASLREEVQLAGEIWGIKDAKIVRCLNMVCSDAVVVGYHPPCGGLAYFLARWYPAGHPDWPQGGWTFSEISTLNTWCKEAQ